MILLKAKKNTETHLKVVMNIVLLGLGGWRKYSKLSKEVCLAVLQK